MWWYEKLWTASLEHGGNQKYHDKLQNVGAGRHQSIKRKEQNNANSESKDKLWIHGLLKY